MKHCLLSFLCVWIPGLAASPAAAAPSRLDLRGRNTAGVEVVPGLAAEPAGPNGLLRTWRIVLPAFRAACYFSADRGNWPADANRDMPWVCGADLAELFRPQRAKRQGVGGRLPNREGICLLLSLNTGEVLALLPLAGPETLSWLTITADGTLEVRLGTLGTEAVTCDAPVLAWARAADVYTACRRVWAQALDTGPGRGRTAWRADKVYPEPFRYLGWCSWEQYHKGIDETILCGAAEALTRSEVPVRWILVDDGHQSATAARQLVSFAPDAAKFPHGWAPLLAQRDPGRLRWFGLWHAFQGLWNGIAPENALGPLNVQLMTVGQAKLPRDDPGAAAAFYNALVGSAAGYGFDFVKIDVQATNLAAYRGTANAARAAATNAQALEGAARRHVQGLINCMAHNPICVANTRTSAVTRCSVDYKLGNVRRAKAHLQQSYTNTLWLGQTVWPDHDMFHSSDPFCGRMMAVSKALSGGPIYLSDAPGDIVAASVRPLCLEDGRLLRPLAPAVPLPDSVFADVLNEPVAYRVIAPLPHGCAAVASYQLQDPTPDTTLHATITPADYGHAAALIQAPAGPWTAPAEGLVVYDWYQRRGARLGSYAVALEGFADSLVLLCPIETDWAVVGRGDKYLSPCAVSRIEARPERLTVELVEQGPLILWSGHGSPRAPGYRLRNLGGGFWEVDLPVEAAPRIVVVTR